MALILIRQGKKIDLPSPIVESGYHINFYQQFDIEHYFDVQTVYDVEMYEQYIYVVADDFNNELWVIIFVDTESSISLLYKTHLGERVGIPSLLAPSVKDPDLNPLLIILEKQNGGFKMHVMDMGEKYIIAQKSLNFDMPDDIWTGIFDDQLFIFVSPNNKQTMILDKHIT